MGVYIRGMEMPSCCDNCWELDDYGDYPRCRITEEQRGYNFPIREKRMDNCPLVPVPPHGRLIDADALEHDFREDAEDAWNKEASPISWADAFDELADMVAEAPTIIPASEEGG